MFDFSTLITDRSPSDLELLRDLLSTPMGDWTAEQLAAFNQAISKGAYNYTDLNRVTACMEYLDETLRAYGYRTGYQRIVVPHQGGGRLPSGYTELQYIESTGTQYIDTGFKPNQNTRVVFNAYLQKRTTGATYFISLAEYEPQAYFQVRIISSAQYLTSDFGNDTENLAEIPLPGRYVIDKNKNVCTVGAESVSNTENEFQAQSNLLLLAGTTTAGVRSASPGTIYACQIYDNGVLVRNFVPCQDPTGNVGLYDLVGAQFYGNAGTGDFIAGPSVGLDGSTLLLLHGDTLKDSSIYDVPITNNGVTVSQDQSKFGGSSLYFNGSSAYLMADISVSGDATVDFWMFRNDSNLDYPTPFNYLDGDLRGLYLHTTNSQTILGCETSNNVFAQDASAVIPAGSWHHIAVVRTGTTATLYVDGISVSEISSITINNDTLYIGVLLDLLSQNRGWFSGYIDEFRVSDVARWTSNFTPPTEPYNDGNSSGQEPTLDPYTWYEADIPTDSQMAQYLSNVLSIWDTIMGDPTLPETMDNLTQEEANQIEAALIEINTAIEQIVAGMARSNSFTFWSGNRPFPTAYSNRGRNWAELDAMDTEWKNWQAATWYLLLYGNLEAEGVVS